MFFYFKLILALPFIVLRLIYDDVLERIAKIPFIKRRKEKQRLEARKKLEEWKRQESLAWNKSGRVEEWKGYQMTHFLYEEDVPFDMYDYKAYVYVESYYDERINTFILKNWENICAEFDKYDYQFIYVPKWVFDTSAIHLANLGEERTEKIKRMLSSMTTVQYSRLLMKSLGFDKDIEGEYCGIFHFAQRHNRDDFTGEDIDKSRFTLCSMKELDEMELDSFFNRYLSGIYEGRNRPSAFNKTVRFEDWERIIKREKNSREIADYDFPIKMKDIAENIKREIETLKKAGYYEMLLHTLGDDLVNELKSVQTVPALSRMEITDDYRIILTDYDKEVKMTPIQKALYIFYLRHPEGVEFKVLSAYYDEILSIYKVLSNRENAEKQRESVRRLVDVTDNAINEKCSRIKEAFLKVADDFIARNYYIVARNEEKKEVFKGGTNVFTIRLKMITLPRNLIVYPKGITDIAISNPTDKIAQVIQLQKDEKQSLSTLNRAIRESALPKVELIQQITMHINQYPTSYAAYFKRALLYTDTGRYEEAIADYQVLIDYDENLWCIALNNQAEAYCLLGQHEKALETINHYFEIEKRPLSDVYYTRAEIYEKLGLTKEAKEDMKCYETTKAEEEQE